MSLSTKKLKYDANLIICTAKKKIKDLEDKDLQWLKAQISKPNQDNEDFSKKINMPPFPEFYILARFADTVYQENYHKYDLPEGWALLTCAQNNWSGYFGAVFFNPNFNQLVISHQGTKIGSWKDLWTDINGVVKNKFVPQIDSAVTFSYWATLLFREANPNIQINITGHSLGGWLAQVTTFTLEYLTRNVDYFTKMNGEETGFHAHTVTFDNPGCKAILLKLKETVDRHESSIDIDRLDISSCLSCPNRINTFNVHLGKLYRVFPDLGKLSGIRKRFFTARAHDIRKIVKSLTREDGIDPKIKDVSDWPSCLSSDYDRFFKWIKKKNFENYDGDDIPGYDESDGTSIRYLTRPHDKNSCRLNVFTSNEREFLQNWKNLQTSDSFIREICDSEMKDIFKIYDNLIKKYEIEKNEVENIRCEEDLEKLIAITKQIAAFYPLYVHKIRAWLEGEKFIPINSQSKTYIGKIEKLIRSDVNFQDDLGLRDMLQNEIVRLPIIAEDTAFEVSRIRSILTRINGNLERVRAGEDDFNSKTRYLSWNGFLHLQEQINFDTIFASNSKYIDLLVIEFPELKIHDNELKQFYLLYNSNLQKIIFVSKPESFIEKIDMPGTKKKNDIEFVQLDQETGKQLLEKSFLHFVDQDISLGTFLGVNESNDTHASMNEISPLISSQLMMNLVSEQFEVIKVGHVPFDDTDLQVYCTDLCEKVETKHLMNLLQSENLAMLNTPKNCNILFFSGFESDNILIDNLALGEQDKRKLKTFIENNIIIRSENKNVKQHFHEICRQHFSKKIFWFHLKEELIYCLKIFDSKLYIQRRFLLRNTINKTTITKIILDSTETFVFGNVRTKKRLVEILELEPEDSFVKKENIFVTQEDGAELFESQQLGKPVHWLKLDQNELVWQNSSDRLQTIRDHIVSELQVEMDELDFMKGLKKVTIISDKPGMGKSTTLATCCTKIPSSWFIRINFRNCGEELERLPLPIDLKSAVEFLKEKQNLLKDERVEQVFQMSLQCNTFMKIFLLFDAYDEIPHRSEENKNDRFFVDSKPPSEKALELLKFFKNQTKAHILVTTRDFASQTLEDTLSVFSTGLKEIDKEQQKNYLNRKWSSCLQLKGQEFGEDKDRLLAHYVDKILQISQNLFGDEILRLFGIPLQLTMIAEVERPSLDDNTGNPFKPPLPIENVSRLYEIFVKKKCKIFMGKKSMHCPLSLEESFMEGIITPHQKLGFELIFPTKIEFLLKNITDNHSKITELNEVGLVNINENKKYQFIHETFGEYFAASFFFDWINEMKYLNESLDSAYHLLMDILLIPKHQTIRLFLNDFLNKTNTISQSWGIHRKKIADLFVESRKIFYNEEKETWAHISVKENHKLILKFMIDAFDVLKEDTTTAPLPILFINAGNSTGKTALQIASWMGEKDICSTLLEHGASVNAKGRNNDSPIHCAARNGHKQVCVLLLDNKADVNEKSENSEIPLARTEWPDLEKRDMLSSERKYLIRLKSSQSSTPLHLAAFEGHADTCELLIERGATVNAEQKNQETPLHFAAFNGHDSVCDVLIQRGALVNAKEENNETPLHLAAYNNHKDLCRRLLENGGESNGKAENNATPLHLAVYKGHKDVIDILLKKEAIVNAQLESGETPLHLAAWNGHKNLCVYLIEKGTEVDVKGGNDATPLHYAACGGHKEVCKVLYNKNAAVQAQAKNEYTPLHFAACNGHKDVCKFLRENGASIDVEGVDNKTPLQLAAAKCRGEVVDYLLNIKT